MPLLTTPEAIRKHMNAMRADPKHPYNSIRDDQEHREAVDEMRRCYEALEWHQSRGQVPGDGETIILG
jgi:hypothetical protein